MSILDNIKSDFAAKSGRKVEVHEWDTVIYFNPLTMFERKQLNRGLRAGDQEGLLLNFLIHKSLDKDGKRIFEDTEESRATLETAADAAIIARIVQAMEEVPSVDSAKNG